MSGMDGHSAMLAALTLAVGIVMVRLGLLEGLLRPRWEHRCVSCGTIVQRRVCPRCGTRRD
jgi:rRNA maturation endonuclease Nob1